jgi:hypothetical protein
MNALSIRTMPELVRRVRAWNEERARRHAHLPQARGLSLVFNLLTGPPFMHAGIFPAGFFDEPFAELVELLPRSTPWEQSNVEYMLGIWKAVNASPHNPSLIRGLKLYLDEIDRRRGLSWRATFPWLVDVE